MKKFLLLIVILICYQIKVGAQYTIFKKAQSSDSEQYNLPVYPFCVDLNVMGGILSQNVKNVNFVNSYSKLQPILPAFSNIKVSKGLDVSGEAEIGYFFDAGRHFGVGTGLIYQNETYKLVEDRFSVQYMSNDANANVFRQELSSHGGFIENIATRNWSIPLVFKYKREIIDRIGFIGDLGLLYNVFYRNSYKSNASFDYQAIYQYSLESNTFVYDNGVVPSSHDVFYTIANAHAANLNQLFETWHSEGFNVGLQQRPLSSGGSVKYVSGSLGLILRPDISYTLNDRTALHAGLYLIYMDVKSGIADNNYRVTDKVGTYNSLLNAITNVNCFNYGVNFGVRLFFGRNADKDHDGVPDRKDRCPGEWGLSALKGCPDNDMDGIPDIDDSCPNAFGLAIYHGCPDADGDGIIDKNDSCPNEFGLPKFYGCPDADLDGIPDKDDSCPHQAGVAKFNGCPDSDGDGIPDNEDACPFVPGMPENKGCPDEQSLEQALADLQVANKALQLPNDNGGVQPESGPSKAGKARKAGRGAKVLERKQIHFDFNKAVIRKSSYKYLDSLAAILKADTDAIMTIDGYCDNLGPASANIKMSKARANSVKKYLIKKGVEADRLKARGHGKREPVGSNKSRRGRAINRRALLVVRSNVRFNKHNKPVNSSAISVYPNDESGSFTILLKTNFEENAEVTITNQTGKVIKKFSIVANQPTEFNMDQPSGLYRFTAETSTTKYEAMIVISQ